jgi:outer membrane protein TolC
VKPTAHAPLLAGALVFLPMAVRGQAEPPAAREPDTLRLGVLQAEALLADPRRQQRELHARRTALRLRNLDAERLPAIAAEGQAQYQSDVVELPLRSPTGATPVPPNDTYDARVVIEQTILDPTVGPRREVVQAELAEAEAGVETVLYGLRAEVNQAFFAAALLQERVREIHSVITDLEARLREVSAYVTEGTALPGDAAAVEATLLERRQDEELLLSERRSALAVLSELTNRDIDDDDVLVLPELEAAVADARARLDELRARPEYEGFGRARERLARQEDVVRAAELPRVGAYGHIGYGRPGLTLLGDDFDAYWLAGVQVRWTPWTWRSASREREALRVQQQIVAADEAAFSDALRRGVQADINAIERLAGTLATDDRIIVLRERIEREAGLRLQEGALTAADYVERQSDVLEARLARARHRVDLAHAQARLLTTLGLEVR